MGGSSSKKTFFGRRKKKSPVSKAWGRLKGALPNKKHKRKKSILPIDIFSLDHLRKEEHSKKKSSSAGDKKLSISIKGLSLEIPLGKPKKEPVSKQTLSLGRKEKNRGGEQTKIFSLGNIKKSSPPSKRFSLPL